MKTMPFRGLVDSLRETLDFYAWKGIPVCRTWPRSPGRRRNSLVMWRAGRFRYINCESTDWMESIRQPYMDMALDSAFAWRDWAVSLYVNGDKWISDYEV